MNLSSNEPAAGPAAGNCTTVLLCYFTTLKLYYYTTTRQVNLSSIEPAAGPVAGSAVTLRGARLEDLGGAYCVFGGTEPKSSVLFGGGGAVPATIAVPATLTSREAAVCVAPAAATPGEVTVMRCDVILGLL